MNLDLSPQKVEFYYDDRDSNAVCFVLENGYFSISVCLYMERDQDVMNLQHFELNDQGCGEYKEVESVCFSPYSIVISFIDTYLKKYTNVYINLDHVNLEMLISFAITYFLVM